MSSPIFFLLQGNNKMVDFAKIHGSTDPKNDAEWFEYEGTDARFLIAPADNPGFNVAALKSMKMVENDDPNRTIYDDQMPSIKIVAQYILLDWDNVELSGEKLPYTVENAAIFMIQYPPVASFINDMAQKLKEQKFGGDHAELKKKSKR